MSQTKISRIETGRTLPSVIDVQRIVTALEVPSDMAAELLALARAANVGYMSLRASARVGLWHRQAELKAQEESASTMRHFLPGIPTGLLQMPQYARQVLSRAVLGRSAGQVERVLQWRLDRQAILDDESRKFVFLMTEQAVRWRNAADEIMVEQVRHMAEVAEKPSVEIAIIPHSATVLAPPLNVFVIYDERLVTVEMFSGSVVLRDPQEITYHLNLFEFFLSHALTGDDAIAFLRSVADEFMLDQ